MDLERKLIDLIPENIADRGRITLDAFLSPLKDLINQSKFPDIALSELQIDLLIRLLSSMDTDKDPTASRVGEREGRIAGPLLERLSGGFNHGVGRSGQLTAPQPKAAGASLMQKLANNVALDAIRSLGLSNVHAGVVTPLSTGMSLALVCNYLRQQLGVDTIIYPRIDHTSPPTGIAFAGLRLVSIENRLVGDAVQMDIEAVKESVSNTQNCAILATTTFFPPRESDPPKELARFCKESDIPLVINNAYGIQSEEIMASIRAAIDAGRVDAIVQSSDKNFLSPVGASIIVTPLRSTIESISSGYAGRASAAPILQTLVSLLLLGLNGYQTLRKEQRANLALLQKLVKGVAESVGQRMLEVKNDIACAMTLDGLDAREIGAKIYNLRVTGPRAIPKGQYGSCINEYPHDYIVMNAAIGCRKSDIEGATAKLYKGLQS